MLGNKRDGTSCEKTHAPSSCPTCGAKGLLREDLPGGDMELICPNLNCDFSYVGPPSDLGDTHGKANSERRFDTVDRGRLEDLEHKLKEASKTLAGRPARSVRRQLAVIHSEIEGRLRGQAEPKEDLSKQDVSSDATQHVPPQFQTSNAVANRVRGIREYYRRKKEQAEQVNGQLPGSPLSDASPRATGRWLDALLKSLREEASRHEQAARDYARVPDLFTLHIEHSARAFELNRIIDLLSNYAQIIVTNGPE